MAPYTRLTPEQRNEMIGARLNKVPLAQISGNMKIPSATVKRTWYKRFERDDEQHDLPRSKHPRKTITEADKRLYRHIRMSPDITWKQILETSSLGRTQTRQKMHEIDPNFRPHLALWAPYISAGNA